MRTPRIAGTWYPNSAEEIERLVGAASRQSPAAGHPAVLIVPHAGYAYSGGVAARAYARLPPDGYDRAIILAPSHRVALGRTFSVEPADEVATPFGTVDFSKKLHDELSALPGSRFTPEAHPFEHAVDIQLPLLRRALPKCEVGAMVVGNWSGRDEPDLRALSEFAAAFRRLLTPRTLVVISTDFTHYGRDFGYVPFRDEVEKKMPALDAEMFEALAKNDNRVWSEALARTGATVCGASCLQLLLATLPESARFERLEYATSADVTGDWSHVVGYTAGVVHADWSAPLKELRPEGPALLSAEAGKALVEIADHSLKVAVTGRDRNAAPEISAAVRRELQRPGGAFVTLTERGMLRGCIGLILSDRPVEEVVREMARAAALQDPRFTPVHPEELPAIDLEVSVLTKPVPVPGPEAIAAGRDGVILRKRGHSAVFLPQVATEQGWDVPTMLMHLSLKAGLDPDAWESGAKFETFRAQIFRRQTP